MKVTTSEEYGLRCLLQLAREHESGRALTLPEIASKEGMPIPNTAKLLRRLRLAGIVVSARGRTGGYTLSRSPREIDLSSALAALDGPMFEHGDCSHYSGSEQVCVRTSDCSVRSLWVAVEGLMRAALGKVSLADLVSTEEMARQRFGSAWEGKAELAAVWQSRRPLETAGAPAKSAPVRNPQTSIPKIEGDDWID
jgi:Rrf2 family transcriptional regulator, iron-sulfur cluster assembly transcription factor